MNALQGKFKKGTFETLLALRCNEEERGRTIT